MGIFGWDLPPGCTMRDIERQCEEPPPQPRCQKCKSFLPKEPDSIEPWEDGYECDGKVKTYAVEYSESEISILGEEFRGQTYEVRQTDCQPDGVAPDAKDHAPHKIIMESGCSSIWICKRCGHRNVISE